MRFLILPPYHPVFILFICERSFFRELRDPRVLHVSQRTSPAFARPTAAHNSYWLFAAQNLQGFFHLSVGVIAVR